MRWNPYIKKDIEGLTLFSRESKKNKQYIAVIVIFTLLVTFLHLAVSQKRAPHIVLEELYYIPLVFGALVFGLRGALLMYLFVSFLYLPFFFGNWTVSSLSLVDRILHVLFTGVFSILAGYLVDRNRRHQKELEKEQYLAGIGQVTTTIVHDLKNPLITILGFARRIREGKGKIDTAAQAITDSAQHMQKIVDAALDFAKPQQMKTKEENIKTIINQASKLCKVKAEEAGVRLSVNISDGLSPIEMDGIHIKRALVNLINNAIEASVRGQEVVISAASENNRMVVKIKDSGTGMDKETVNDIFTPFYSKKRKGTGLGMTIAKKIIDGHRGKICVNSDVGLGTEVILRLPLTV